MGNEQTDGVIEAIKSATRTGTIAYSRIFVSDMEQEIRIRTSEVGVDAISYLEWSNQLEWSSQTDEDPQT